MAKLFNLMTMSNDKVEIDVKKQVINHNGTNISFTDINLFDSLWLDFTIADTFDQANGKFGAVWGNVALVDCNYLFDQVLVTLARDSLPLIITDFTRWREINEMINEVQAYNDYYNITFCTYAYELDGVLKDEASYYLGDKNNIAGQISTAGGVITEALTLLSNFTLSAPLKG
jgi:hypothetical protein